jgi:hypothetical protein
MYLSIPALPFFGSAVPDDNTATPVHERISPNTTIKSLNSQAARQGSGG